MLVPGAPRASTRPRTWCARAGLSSSMGISLPAGSSGGAAHAAAAATRTTDLRLDERKGALRVVDALEMSAGDALTITSTAYVPLLSSVLARTPLFRFSCGALCVALG